MIDKVQIGDKMIVSAGHPRARTIVMVEKVTATGQFTCSDGHRYTAAGRRVGSDGWNTIYAHKATDESIRAVAEENERRDLSRKINDLRGRAWMNESLHIVRVYAAALAEAERVAGMMGKDGAV